jgi:hypothetical protein
LTGGSPLAALDLKFLLGVLYAALGAFTFALNNVAMRRGW